MGRQHICWKLVISYDPMKILLIFTLSSKFFHASQFPNWIASAWIITPMTADDVQLNLSQLTSFAKSIAKNLLRYYFQLNSTWSSINPCIHVIIMLGFVIIIIIFFIIKIRHQSSVLSSSCFHVNCEVIFGNA